MDNIFVASMWKELLFTAPLGQQKQLCGGSNPLGNDMSQLNRNMFSTKRRKCNRSDTKNENTHKLVATNHKASFKTSTPRKVSPVATITAGAVIFPLKTNMKPETRPPLEKRWNIDPNQQFISTIKWNPKASPKQKTRHGIPQKKTEWVSSSHNQMANYINTVGFPGVLV